MKWQYEIAFAVRTGGIGSIKALIFQPLTSFKYCKALIFLAVKIQALILTTLTNEPVNATGGL